MEAPTPNIYTDGKTALRHILAANCPLIAAAWADFEALLRPQFLAKGEYLCEEGAYPSNAAYLISGIARAFYRNQDGLEYNKTFFTAGSFPSPLATLILQAENYINLQALADSHIFWISYPGLTALFARHRCLETFVRRMVELTWVEKELREINLAIGSRVSGFQLAQCHEIYQRTKNNVMKRSENTILITGGSSGIGLALAEKLVGEGNTVIAAGSNLAKLEKAQQSIPGLHALQCDLGNPVQLDELVMQVEQQFPALNILINNAGLQYNYDWQRESHLVDKINREFQVNLLAPALLTAQLLPLLTRQEAAAIVNVTSALAWAPKENAPVYCASKAALHSLTQSLRWQLENTNIKVVELVPPLVETAMTSGRGKGKIQPEELANLFAERFFKGESLITTGKIRMLKAINRVAPGVMERIMRKG